MATDFLISFDDLKAGSAAVKRLVQAFTRAGATVASSDIDPKTRRTSGVNYRQVLITFTDNQKVVLGVKTTGDIFEVRVNGAALAIKNQDNQVKAVGEIAKALDAGRAKFQAKMARTKVALPKGITTAAPKMEQRLQEAETTLDAEIAAVKARITDLRAELGDPALDSVHTAAGETFDGGEWDTLYQMSKADKLEDGDIPAKDGRDNLVERGFVERGDGMNWLTEKGKEVAKVVREDILARRRERESNSMDSVDVPLATFERPEVIEAQAIAARLAAGDILDGADLSHALATLHNALDVVETNYPINLAEGDIAQADLEERAAESFRDAIKILEERKPLAA